MSVYSMQYYALWFPHSFIVLRLLCYCVKTMQKWDISVQSCTGLIFPFKRLFRAALTTLYETNSDINFADLD